MPRQELKKDGATDDDIELQLYSERLDAGLFTLQTIDFVTAEVCVGCGEEVSAHVCKPAPMQCRLRTA